MHPYQWATIGKEISHIENATMDDVRSFFFRYYVPANAVLVVAGNVTVNQVRTLAEKWFGPIASPAVVERKLPQEALQKTKRAEKVDAEVPASALYKAYHMPGRFHSDFFSIDLMSDILARGESSRLYQKLVKEKEIFSSLSSFTMGSLDPGLLVISGRVKDGIFLEDAEAEVTALFDHFIAEGTTDSELEKVKNQAYSTLEFGEVEVMNRAMNLAFAKLSGDANHVNEEASLIEAVTPGQIQAAARKILREENSNVLYYHARKG